MRNLASLIALYLVGAGAAGADTPLGQTASGVAATATVAAAPAATPDAATPTTATESADAEVKRMRALGYTPETRRGVRMYCRNQAELGTRFPHKTCGTAVDLARATQASKDAIDDAQRRSSSSPVGK